MVGELLSGAEVGALIAIFAGMMILFLLIVVALYVYMSFAFMAIAKKAKLTSPGLAWIPGVGPMIIAYQASKMHWWPWLLLIGLVIPILNFVVFAVFYAFFIAWLWKTYEAINKPGWWSILILITPVGLIMAGIAAWSKD
ncbi:MAG: hypothetical protein WC758_03000 [Candidatus Woesearchaeota archaeon]|jgi:hypothetical protein